MQYTARPKQRGIRQAIGRVFSIASLPLLVVVYAIDWLIGTMESAIGHKRMPYFFVLPNMLIFGVFILLPVFLNFYYSLTVGEQILPAQREYAALANFERIADCPNLDSTDLINCPENLFWRAMGNTARYVIFEVPLMLVSAMAIALALNRPVFMRGFFRSAFFFPVLLSPVVVGITWSWFLQNRTGLLNTLIISSGGSSISFLTDPTWAFFWSVFVAVWAQVGFYALILLAGLQAIPPVLYEAATIDGADAFAQFRRVTFPLWLPTMLVVTVLGLIRSVQQFDIVYNLTGGGPGTANMMMVQYIYEQGFQKYRYGMAAAASLVIAVVLAGLTLAQIILNRRQAEGGQS